MRNKKQKPKHTNSIRQKDVLKLMINVHIWFEKKKKNLNIYYKILST